jgi:hypothetical protein
VRRAILLVLTAFVVAALLNTFGQRPTTVRAAEPAASMELYAPDRLRAGLIYEARLRIHAHREIKQAILLLERSTRSNV